MNDAIEAIAKSQNIEVKSNTNSIVILKLKDTVSFQQIAKLHEALRSKASELSSQIDVFVGTQADELLLSCRIGKKRSRDDALEAPASLLEDVSNALKKIEKAAKAPIEKKDLEDAKKICEDTVVSLNAIDGDGRAVQSFGVFHKTLAASDTKPRIVLAFRIHAG